MAQDRSAFTAGADPDRLLQSRFTSTSSGNTSASDTENGTGSAYGGGSSPRPGQGMSLLETALGYYDVLGGKPRFGTPSRPPVMEYEDDYQAVRASLLCASDGAAAGLLRD